MRIIIGWIVFIASVICGLYVGGWLMFVKPIIEVCTHLDADTLTGTITGIAILKCMFAGTVGLIIAQVGSIIATALFRSR